MANITIEQLKPNWLEQYSSYVEGHPKSRFTHSIEWSRFLKKTLGFKPLTLIALQDQKIVGILPLFQSFSLINGKYCSSSPIPTYAGPLTSSYEVLLLFIQAVKKICPTFNYINVYSGDSLDNAISVNHKILNAKRDVTFFLKLGSDIQELFYHLKKNIRRDIRRGGRFGFKTEIVESISNSKLNQFYHLYLQTYCKKHGLIPHSKLFFINLFKYMPSGTVKLFLLYHKSQCIASVITLNYNQEIYYNYSAHDNSYSNLQPITYLIWDILKDGIVKGYKIFNMGESSIRNPGLTNYKKRWCSDSQLTSSYFFMGRMKEIPISFADEYGWQKRLIQTMPIQITRSFLTPFLRFIF